MTASTFHKSLKKNYIKFLQTYTIEHEETKHLKCFHLTNIPTIVTLVDKHSNMSHEGYIQFTKSNNLLE